MSSHIRILFIVILTLAGFSGFSQQKKTITHADYDDWKQIENYAISDDGNSFAYEINPQIGDGWLLFSNKDGSGIDSVARGQKAVYSSASSFAVYRIVPPYDTVRQEKLKKVKKDKMTKDSLGITLFNSSKMFRFPKLKEFSVPEKSSDWIAMLLETPKVEKKTDTIASDTAAVIPVKNKKKSDKKSTGDLLVLFNPITGDSVGFPDVKYFSLSNNGISCAIVRQFGDSIDSVRVSVYSTGIGIDHELMVREGFSSGISTDQKGEQVAFTYSSDTSKQKSYELYYYSLRKNKLILASGDSLSRVKKGWCVSEYMAPWFHENGNELYFGTSLIPEIPAKDTLTDDEKVSVDIWNWQDTRLQPQQLKELDRDKKQAYAAVYYTDSDKLIQLANPQLPVVSLDKRSEGNYSLCYTDLPYLRMSSWDAGNYRDVYLVNRETGTKLEILHQTASSVSLSPDQKYVLWYNLADSSWNAYDIKRKLDRQLTKSLGIAFFDELNDVPDEANPYGMAGWTSDGMAIIYDAYDLWMLDPAGKNRPLNITLGSGREHKLQYRYIKLDKEQRFLPNELLLSTFNKLNKDAGFSSVKVDALAQPKLLLMKPAGFSTPIKAKKSDVVLWRQESFDLFPDLYTSNVDFGDIVRLTDAYPEQADFAWGSVDLVAWTTFDGDSLQGLLYKPADFDPQKKYPMIVYFYERYSDDLHRYYIPKPIRSVINFSYYTSNGYLIFIPDIVYKTGYPGQSAFNSIISGTQALVDRYPYIDRTKMAMQGQSWGGYQTAYLVTQTNMFAAAMAGAPVSNMTSAYGGIRWGAGVSRAFQYEQSQSRIGGTLWDDLPLYLANSPVFFADQVETPLLIMHNDNDGAVPWYQGIEFFIALRRLNKPVWMLVYNGAPHNLARRADCVDLTIRMQQFFDHYLKGAPAPVWMAAGIPALEKGKSFGFDLEEK